MRSALFSFLSLTLLAAGAVPARAGWLASGSYNWYVNGRCCDPSSGICQSYNNGDSGSKSQMFPTRSECNAALAEVNYYLAQYRPMMETALAACRSTPYCTCSADFLVSNLQCGGFDDFTTGNGVSFANGQGGFDFFGSENGQATFQPNYTFGFSNWASDAQARWESYLQRNAFGRETGLAIWPDSGPSRFMEALYRTLKGKETKNVRPVLPELVEKTPTPASTAYEESLAYNATPKLMEAVKPEEVVGNDWSSPAENYKVDCFGNLCGRENSVAPGYAFRYSSLTGQSETSALRLEALSDGRALFTDESNRRWTFRAYGSFNPLTGEDVYYRIPRGSAYRVIFGKLPTRGVNGDAPGFRIETPDGGLYELAKSEDGIWRPARFTAADGSYLVYTRDTSGRMTGITDLHDRKFAFTYDAAGRTVGVSRHNGVSVGFSYDDKGRVVESSATGKAVSRYAYDASGRLSSVKTGNLASEHYRYDASGRILEQYLDGGVNSSSNYYDDASSRTVVTDGLGVKTVYDYKIVDARKLIERVTDAFGNTAHFGYDGNYNVVVTTDALGRAVYMERNSNGDPVLVRNVLGDTVRSEYAVKMRYTDAEGDHTDYYSRPVRVTDARGGVTSFDYDAGGNVTRVRDPLGNTAAMSYDRYGHILKATGPDGASVRYEYGKYSALSKTTDALGREMRYTYDEDSRPVAVTDPAGRTVRFVYDAADNVSSITDASGSTTEFVYGDGAGAPGARLLKLTDALGRAYTFDYDAYGRLARTGNPAGNARTYEYNKVSQLIASRDAFGGVTRFTYDKLGRLAERAAGGTKSRYAYDAVGNMTSVVSPSGMLGMKYDAVNRPAEVTQGFADGKTYTLKYGYDSNGNRTSLTTPWGGYTYSYDLGNRLVSINLSEGRSIRFEYDKAGRRTVMRLPNGTETRYSYDAAGQVLNVEHRNGSDTLAFARYGYDKAGNRVSKVDNAGEHIYGYDQLSRLTDVSVTGAVGKRSEYFAYDAVGNRTEDNLYKGYKYDAANRLLENTAYSYTYDANGNLLSRTDKADNSVSKYSYNADNKLVRVEMPEGVVVAYTYDAGGRRIERAVSKAGTETVTRYVYDGENIIAELDKDGNPTEIFTNGPGIDEPLIMTRSDDANYYYHADALGSITALSDGKGQIAERMAYTAYGLPTRYNAKGEFIENSAIGNTRTYTAREQDDDTGLYYYRARYYDAETGRFTQEDPAGLKGGIDLYAYGPQNPISYVDPMGLLSMGDVANAIGGFGNGLTQGRFKIGNGYYDGCSGAFEGGYTAGTAWGAATAIGIGGEVLGAVAGRILGNALIGSQPANPVPTMLARAIPGTRSYQTLGLPGSTDVFVTAAEDIKGLNAAQLSQRLAIRPSPNYTVYEFPTPSSGLASPINRLDEGFIGGGKTAGGAREFVLPQGPIPDGAIRRIVGQ